MQQPESQKQLLTVVGRQVQSTQPGGAQSGAAAAKEDAAGEGWAEVLANKIRHRQNAGDSMGEAATVSVQSTTSRSHVPALVQNKAATHRNAAAMSVVQPGIVTPAAAAKMAPPTVKPVVSTVGAATPALRPSAPALRPAAPALRPAAPALRPGMPQIRSASARPTLLAVRTAASSLGSTSPAAAAAVKPATLAVRLTTTNAAVGTASSAARPVAPHAVGTPAPKAPLPLQAKAVDAKPQQKLVVYNINGQLVTGQGIPVTIEGGILRQLSSTSSSVVQNAVTQLTTVRQPGADTVAMGTPHVAPLTPVSSVVNATTRDPALLDVASQLLNMRTRVNSQDHDASK